MEPQPVFRVVGRRQPRDVAPVLLGPQRRGGIDGEVGGHVETDVGTVLLLVLENRLCVLVALVELSRGPEVLHYVTATAARATGAAMGETKPLSLGAIECAREH